MDENLVIVESPAKAQTIGKFLGKGFKVMPSYGHIRDLKTKSFSINEKTFEPDYVIPEDKLKVVEGLRKASKKVENVWLASDEDREGEAIAWHLAVVLGLDVKKTKRIVFHEITKPAIEKALSAPRVIDMNLVNAQQARRVLDRIVGFKLSPVLWRKVKGGLSAGRVQSVAVRLVAEREKEIREFEATASFAVVGKFVLETAEGERVEVRAELNKRFKSEEDARAFLEDCKGKGFRVGTIRKKQMKRSPQPPFMTSTLQQEAARKFGFPVSLTMRLAQGLYERGLITYMRTDSLNLSNLCVGSSKKLITEKLGERYSKPRQFHTKAKGAQEAHEAIRPTYMDREVIEGTAQEKKLYEMIWKRTIACQMSDALVEKTTAEVLIDGKEEKLGLEGEVVTFDGFMRVYKAADDDEGKGNDAHQLPPLKEGQVLEVGQIVAEERFSQRPARYNEATLVHKLEELGIGRPSTYAPTISTIQQRGYVVRENREGVKRNVTLLTLKNDKITRTTRAESAGAEKQKLFPTDVGMVVNDYLETAFPEILDYNFTAKVERGFDAVAAGEQEWTELMQSFYRRFMPSVESALAEKTELKVGERVLGNDPATGRQVSARIGRFGKMVQIGVNGEPQKPQFASIPKEISLEEITLEQALELFRLPRILGDFNGTEVKVNNGRYGPYVQWGKLYVSIPKDKDVMTISLSEACELVEKKRAVDAASHLKRFDEDPGLEIRNGRYGPYISYGGRNYKIPASLKDDPSHLTLEQCRQIIDSAPAAGKTYKRRRTP